MSKMIEIGRHGFSRIPVYHISRRNIIGVLHTKTLLLISQEDRRQVGSLNPRAPLLLKPLTPLSDVLAQMRKAGTQLAIVCRNPMLMRTCVRTGSFHEEKKHNVLGIITTADGRWKDGC